jgi:hypothetical protein
MNARHWLGGLALALVVSPGLAIGQEKTVVEAADVRSGPSPEYYPTSRLRAGERVMIVGNENGMLAIRPPAGSFDLVNFNDIQVSGDGATVIKETMLRRGSSLDDQKMDTSFSKLQPGTQVRLIPGVPLFASSRERLQRIVPPPGDVRYIPPQAVGDPATPASTVSTGQGIPLEWGGAPQPNVPASGTSRPGDWSGQVNAENAPQSARVTGQTEQPASPPQPIMPTTYAPPPQQTAPYDSAASAQNRRQNELIPPAGNSFAQNYAQPTAAPPSGFRTGQFHTSQRSSLTAGLSDDPQWANAERLESTGDIKQAILLYDDVGKRYGQIDPNLAIRAMNRAQYLRNEISAGVAHTQPISRSAKQDYTGTATTEVNPSFTGRPNVATLQSGNRTAVSDVYAKPPTSYLPNESAISGSQKNHLTDLSQPIARANKPASESTKQAAQYVWSTIGTLDRTSLIDKDGKRFYRLTPNDFKKDGLIYCMPEPGVNLDSYLNRQVRLYGAWGYHRDMRQNYMQVLQAQQVP